MTWKGERQKHSMVSRGLRVVSNRDIDYQFNSGSAITTDELTRLAARQTMTENEFIELIRKRLYQYNEVLEEVDIRFLKEFYRDVKRVN